MGVIRVTPRPSYYAALEAEAALKAQEPEPEFILTGKMSVRMEVGGLKEGLMRLQQNHDVTDMIPGVDKLLFADFIRAAACRVGQILNVHDIAQDVGVSDDTAKRWLQVLEKSEVVFYLRPYFNNLLKRTVSQPFPARCPPLPQRCAGQAEQPKKAQHDLFRPQRCDIAYVGIEASYRAIQTAPKD